MKNATSHPQTSKLIASHALVIAVFTAPYFVAVWGDIYNIAKIGLASIGLPTSVAAPVVIDQTQMMSMSLLSSAAALVSIVAFTMYLLKKRRG